MKRILAHFLFLIAWLTSYFGTAVVAYNYGTLKALAKTGKSSANPESALLLILPYLLVIIILIALGVLLLKSVKAKEAQEKIAQTLPPNDTKQLRP